MTDSTRLTLALEAMADAMNYACDSELWTAFTCIEVESIAEVLRAGGYEDVADGIIEMHTEGDDRGDMHHPDYDPEDDGS